MYHTISSLQTRMVTYHYYCQHASNNNVQGSFDVLSTI